MMKTALVIAFAINVLFGGCRKTSITEECTISSAPSHTSSSSPRHGAKNQLKWGPCQDPANDTLVATLQCATLEVPIDYQNLSDSRRLTLQLARLPARQKPSKGTVIYNPGGPGDGGRNSFAATASLGYVVIPGATEFDWVTWDLRGTNPDTILSNCFDEQESRIVGAATLDPVNNSIFAVTEAWSSNRRLWQTCKEKFNENGTLIGSIYDVRDMLAIVDALDEDGLLRYYGDSYGTVLGQLFARLFPDRVGRMVLNGVVNLQEYLAGTFVQEPSAIDATLFGFLSTCEARPDICDLTLLDTSRKSVSQQVNDLLKSLAIGNDTFFDPPLDWPMIAPQLYNALKTPLLWSTASTVLYNILTHNQTEFNDVAAVLQEITIAQIQASTIFNADGTEFVEIQHTIRCSDVIKRILSPAADREIIGLLNNQSYWGGPIIAGTTQIPCAAWPLKAKEQYTADLHTIETKNPILIVNNVYDPITPLVSARQATLGFDGSRLLVQNAYGHTTGSTPSSCTNDYIRAYLATGALPLPETICNTDVPPFFGQDEFSAAIQKMIHAGS